MTMSLSRQLSTRAYQLMLRIRFFEEAVQARQIYSHLSIGQEAAIVGACIALRADDYITGTHRSHGHPIAKGADLNPLMAELLGKETGICRGRGGSMHFADISLGIIGESAIVGGGIPLALGAGLSAKIRRTDQVSLAFFGDGAVNQGTFHESMNMAAIWRLPVIFFCENNSYAATTPMIATHGQPIIAKRAEGYGLPGVTVNGQDLEAVYEATKAAVERAREGEGATLIEARTYRFDEHCAGLSISKPYRSEAEVSEKIRDSDPLTLFRHRLVVEYGVSPAELEEIDEAVRREIQEANAFAEGGDFPSAGSLNDFMYSMPIPQQSLHRSSAARS